MANMSKVEPSSRRFVDRLPLFYGWFYILVNRVSGSPVSKIAIAGGVAGRMY
jgi:hypothetical protein